MIWSEHAAVGDSREALSRHLVSEIAAACGTSAPEHTEDIAQAVAAYCTRHRGEFAVSSEYIAFLVSRALRAVGHEPAAGAFGAGRGSPALETAAQFRDVPPALWSAFSARLIRPSKWLVDNGRVIWVLDLSRFRLDADLHVELAFHQAVRAILSAVAEIWDGTAGAGILGLRGIPPNPSRKKPGIDVQSLCRDLLERIGSARGWVYVPQVLSLDAAG